jgi:hypothetical protein
MSKIVCIFLTINDKNNISVQIKINIFARNKIIKFNCVKKIQNSTWDIIN